jgi:hypothetical protein
MALARQVAPRLWLGGVLSAQRDTTLIHTLAALSALGRAGPVADRRGWLGQLCGGAARGRPYPAGAPGPAPGVGAVARSGAWASGQTPGPPPAGGRHAAGGTRGGGGAGALGRGEPRPRRAEHRLHRAAEWHVVPAPGALGPADALGGPPAVPAACRYVLGRHGLHLLHESCAPQASGPLGPAPPAGAGGGADGPGLERRRVAGVAGAAPARAPACAARTARRPRCTNS